MKPATEKRSFYRLTDVVGLACSPLDDDATGLAPGAPMPLAAQLADIDREFNKTTNMLWQENPVFAQAVGLLNRKLAIITASALPEDGEQPGKYEELVVSISGSGIAFESGQAYPQGARLGLSLVLKPAHTVLEMSATVIDCEPLQEHAGQRHWVRASFEEGNETAQEQLIQHIVQRQSAQIREGAPEPGSIPP